MEGKGVPHRISSVDQLVFDFVKEYQGDRAFKTILVANNGLGAVKFIRSVRMWAVKTLGNDKAISFVAMATPEDIRINAEHLRLADQFVEVPGGTNNHNYANVRLIVQIAERVHVDAVWPGWGHASEDPQLPLALSETESGIRFLGPPSVAMAALGDKVGSTILAQAAGVPTYAWSGSGVQISFETCHGVVPSDVYQRACLRLDNALERCRSIGFPVMLKASWGGGGKGIRSVRSEADVESCFKQVQGEVPGSPIFAMKMASQCRHLEVQLLCDMYGNVCSLFSRDCSLQRRHQKIVEEGPVLGVPESTLLEMEKSARALAKAVGYVGAATVEYLYSVKDKKYYFLELNPRLQVEHPVTEGITNVNLPACQVMVGMGIPLHRIPDIRSLFLQNPEETNSIDFETSLRKEPQGHVIAVRITSENANDGFKPTSGNIDELHFRSTADVWGYFSVKSRGGIHEFSDSQFGHLFAKGKSRQESIRSMILALKEIQIRGEIRTTVDYIIDMIQESDFVDQHIHTAWLDQRIAQQITSKRPPWTLALVSGAVVKAMQNFESRSMEYIEALRKGQVPSETLRLTSVEEDLVLDRMKYHVSILRQSQHRFRIVLKDSFCDSVARKQPDGGLLLQMDGQKHVVYWESEATGMRLSIDACTCFLEKDLDPSRVLAPSAGKIYRFLVEDKSHVKTNEPYAELEVMKMMMPLLAPADGTVHFQMQEGAVLNGGDLIAILELDDAEAVPRSVAATQTFPATLGPPQVHKSRADDRFDAAMEAALDLLAGYERDVDETVAALVETLQDKDLAFFRWAKKFSEAQSRLPVALKEELESILSRYDTSSFDIVPDVVCSDFPAEDLSNCIKRHIEATRLNDRPALEAALEPLRSVSDQHRNGKFDKRVIQQLLESYLDVEEIFQANDFGLTQQDIIYSLRQEHEENLQKVLEIVLSHQASERKAKFVKRLLVHWVLSDPMEFRSVLRRLATIVIADHMPILRSAHLLLEYNLFEDLKAAIRRCLSNPEASFSSLSRNQIFQKKPLEGLLSDLRELNLSQSTQSHLHFQKMEMLVEAPAAIEDPLLSLFSQPEIDVSEDEDASLMRLASLGMEFRTWMTYIRRIYAHQLTQDIKLMTQSSFSCAFWTYKDPQFPITEAHGVMVLLSSLSALKKALTRVAEFLKRRNGLKTTGAFHCVLTEDQNSSFDLFREAEESFQSLEDVSVDGFDRDPRVAESLKTIDPREASKRIQACLQSLTSEFRHVNFRSVAFVIQTQRFPLRKGFLWNAEQNQFIPQLTLKDVDLPVAEALELSKLEKLNPVHSFSRNRQWHIYTVTEKPKRGPALNRVFLRGLIHPNGRFETSFESSQRNPSADLATSWIHAIENVLSGALAELLGDHHGVHEDGNGSVDWSHVFFATVQPFPFGSDLEGSISKAFRTTSAKWMVQNLAVIRQARVSQIEIKIPILDQKGAWRIVFSLPTGHEVEEEHVDIYRESIDGNLEPQSFPQGERSGHIFHEPYAMLSPTEQKRRIAQQHSTTYCYDFPFVFANALKKLWSENASNDAAASVPACIPIKTQEFRFRDEDPKTSPYEWKLDLKDSEIGQNTIGMVGWIFSFQSPEAPLGRQIVIIANDITFQFGAFGPKEDAFFKAVVEEGLQRRLPIVYLAANSGARVGLANDVREKLKVEWNHPNDPSKGFRYLYLENDDYESLRSPEGRLPLVAQRNARGHWEITDIVGHEDGIGVECLSGSGAIAGSFSKAFREGLTFTVVTGRTVGIGAYLARLGRRCIQTQQPIILTGFQALNKLLGRKVYSSQLQLGGPRVMGVNGVSHHVVHDDLEAIQTLLKWLSFTPCQIDASPNTWTTLDPSERDVEYMPKEEEKFDPRKAISGWIEGGRWISGLFDEGSWLEAHATWASTVVTGRARLGGHPVGVIAVETETVFKTLPADPGMQESTEQRIAQAGQVWYPDSAQKTAEAMEEFNLEHLPLIVLANWRGFSGGQRDLFEGILQSGSLIVEHLRTYRQPVFVYLPPRCELRGGAWVVIDSKINASMVEMFADPKARSGVLEPDGVVEIKFKKADLIKMMHRLDPKLVSMSNQDRQTEIHQREQELLPVYHQIALQYAEMHDTPTRMFAKGVIQAIVPWKRARAFFIQRLERRLAQDALLKRIFEADSEITFPQAAEILRSWCPSGFWENDVQMQRWMEASKDQIEQELQSLQNVAVSRQFRQLFFQSHRQKAFFDVLKEVMEENSEFKSSVTTLLNDI